MGNVSRPTLTISDYLGEYEYKEKSRVKSDFQLRLLL